MWHYRVRKRAGSLARGLLFLFISLIPLLKLSGDVAEWEWTHIPWIGIPLVLFLGFFAGGVVCLREVYEIRVTDDGMVMFVRLLGTTRIPAREIRHLEGILRKDYDGNQRWHLKVRYAGERFWGAVEVPEFKGVKAFVDAIRTWNPALQINGLWSMGPP